MTNKDDLYNSQFNALGTTTGALPFHNATNLTNLLIGTAGQVLTVVAGLPAWVTGAAAFTFSIAADTGTADPIATTETVTLHSLNLPVLTTARTVNNRLDIDLVPGTAGQVITTVGGVVVWATPATATVNLVAAPTASTDPGAAGDIAIGGGYAFMYDIAATEWTRWPAQGGPAW